MRVIVNNDREISATSYVGLQPGDKHRDKVRISVTIRDGETLKARIYRGNLDLPFGGTEFDDLLRMIEEMKPAIRQAIKDTRGN